LDFLKLLPYPSSKIEDSSFSQPYNKVGNRKEASCPVLSQTKPPLEASRARNRRFRMPFFSFLFFVEKKNKKEQTTIFLLPFFYDFLDRHTEPSKKRSFLDRLLALEASCPFFYEKRKRLLSFKKTTFFC
jgi:hypothetical protein